ncbi:hypothetical protein CIL05_13160 [Virgibacillus profundi]|uniref:Sporulation protein n=1 Tax=Virgibacillus profundi TaxID=2024555 RepID=A0A2A2IBD8_9BACI|nr:YhcN/YlaJ family sporulation lipoprotein [Virgibacillus profundi]PAV28927.1 hypothetical protein CIL05_13160 [Virgibacillus profundi]PXY53095.1 hypothetical protein CIT14_13285 [Virgibacillus profundi]
MFKIISFTLLIIFTVGCANTDEDTQTTQEKINTSPINYETEQERKERLNIRDQTIGEKGGYPQSDQDGVNAGDNSGENSDAFTNEESMKISKQLKEKKEIVQAQVASTDDRIIVAVILSEQTDPDIKQMIESEVSKTVSDKQIIVYTDEVHWDHMKNLDARLGSEKREFDIEDYIDDFIKRND